MSNLEYLWKEYSYRHDLCWRTVFRITSATVLLSIIPYVEDGLSKADTIGWLTYVPPALGAAIAAFGTYVLLRELRLLGMIRLVYRPLQNEFFARVVSDPQVLKEVKHKTSLSRCMPWFEPFAALVCFWQACLFVLALANVWLLPEWIQALRHME